MKPKCILILSLVLIMAANEADIIQIRPQPGPQEAFLSTPADIAIFGGAAGGGKSYALLMEPLRHINNPQFGAVIFRRTTRQVLAEGGLWDTSQTIYQTLKGKPRENRLDWTFPLDARIAFAHMEHEKNRYDWQGAQIAFIGFDELTQFSRSQFFYLLSRNRSVSGVRPYIRATCNPDPDSFVKDLIRWYLDENEEYANPKKSGKIRWFVNVNDELHWSNKPEKLKKQFPHSIPKSFTFIPSYIYDNKILLERNPEYLSNLMALQMVERLRLLQGNWKVRPAAGNYFRREWFEVIDRDSLPVVRQKQRSWDRASTKPSAENEDPDWTVGLKMSRCSHSGLMFIEDVVRLRESPGRVEKAIYNTATRDGQETVVIIEQDPGQAGEVEVQYYIKKVLFGYIVKLIRPTTDKITRARLASSQAEAGNIKIVRGAWNEDLFNELENFPDGAHDDQVDALSANVNAFVEGGTIDYKALTEY